jgi:hypothetical protein
VGVLLLFSTPSFFILVDAGPLNSFAASPIPYWDDDSLDISLSWDSTEQTVAIDWANDTDEYSYFEDMSSVSDWTAWAPASISTDGDIATLKTDGTDDWNQAYSNSLGANFEDHTFKIRYKLNISLSICRFYLMSADGAGGSTVQMITLPSSLTTWQVYSTIISSSTTVESIKISCPAQGSDWQIEIDYISIYDDIGDLDVGIPITRQDTQAVELYMNTTDLDSEVRLELYYGTTASGTYCTVNSTHVNFIDEGINGDSYAATSGLSRIAFGVNNEEKSAIITVKDQDNLLMNYWTDSYIISGNNWLRMTDSSFEGSFTLYYVNGDTNYTYVRAVAEWTKSGLSDDNVTQHQQGVECTISSDVVNHSITYFSELPYLQYLRTEWFQFFDITPVNDFDIEYNITIGVGAYEVLFQFLQWEGSGTYSYNATVSVYNSTYTFYQQRVSYTALTDYEYGALAKIMYWRTQEDHIGIMFWGDINERNYWTDALYWDTNLQDWVDVHGENETIWISDFAVDSFVDTNVTLGYKYYTSFGATGTAAMQYNYFEYSYWLDSGVVQPHFSSTWWGAENFEHSPWDSDQNIDEWWFGDPATPPETPPEIPWYYQMFEFLENAVSNAGLIISDVLGTIGDGIASAISGGITITLDVLNNVFGGLPDWGNPLVGTISGILNFMTTIGTLIIMFFNFLIAIVGWINAGVIWFNTYLLTTNSIMVICGILILFPVMALTGNNIMGKGTGWSGAAAWLLIYANTFKSILSAAWNITTGVLNLIGNFLPFT